MVDRWRNRAMLPPGQGQLYWHVLVGDKPAVRDVVTDLQQRMEPFKGLDPTPLRWLHMTTLVVGRTDEIAAVERQAMVREARSILRRVTPITVMLSRLFYHPEAIGLLIHPSERLTPLQTATQSATWTATQRSDLLAAQSWTPHITIAYSSSEQPAAPIIDTLGRHAGPCEFIVDSISLVDQDGPENRWDWRPLATVRLGD
jgi:2'-5' RNA ligase